MSVQQYRVALLRWGYNLFHREISRRIGVSRVRVTHIIREIFTKFPDIPSRLKLVRGVR